MRKHVILFIACLFVASGLTAQQNSSAPKNDLKQFYLVLLYKGPNRNQDSITAAEIQKKHLANIERLFNEGKIEVAGPCGDDGELRGIFIFDVPTEREVVQLLLTDPAVTTGRLKYEIHPWWTGTDVCIE